VLVDRQAHERRGSQSSDLAPDRLRWAAAEGVSEDVIAAALLLHERSAEEIVPQLSPAELNRTRRPIATPLGAICLVQCRLPAQRRRAEMSAFAPLLG
jgi:hypothetical protein